MIKQLIKKTFIYKIYKKRFPYSLQDYQNFNKIYKKSLKNLKEVPNKNITGDIIVSLTTYPGRIKAAGIVISSIMQQTLIPNRIVLTLAESQFPQKRLPKLLRKEIKKGLEIIWTEDLRSHKKYYDVMKKYPESLIITVDDDTCYTENFVSDLYNSYKRYPSCISCTLAREIQIENNKFSSYESWPHSTVTDTPSLRTIPLGIGGVLYPPHSLNEEVFNKINIKKLCPNADDLWLKIMELLNNPPTPVVLTSKFTGIEIPLTQINALYLTNTLQNQNDTQLNLLLENYNENNGLVEKILQNKIID